MSLIDDVMEISRQRNTLTAYAAEQMADAERRRGLISDGDSVDYVYQDGRYYAYQAVLRTLTATGNVDTLEGWMQFSLAVLDHNIALQGRAWNYDRGMRDGLRDVQRALVRIAAHEDPTGGGHDGDRC